MSGHNTDKIRGKHAVHGNKLFSTDTPACNIYYDTEILYQLF